MAITSTDRIRLGFNSFLFTAVSNLVSPTYYWYQDGELVQFDARSTYQADIWNESIVDVFDDPATAPSQAYPAQVTLEWNPSDFGDARTYRIREWDDPDLIELATVPDPLGAGVLRFVSAALSEGDHTLRIYPVDENGIEGTYRETVATVRRFPEQEDVTISYDLATTTLTADAA